MAEAAPLDWVSFDGGIFAVGHDGDGFAYDNEGPRHDELVRPFKLANRCVTNSEWIGIHPGWRLFDTRRCGSPTAGPR